MKSMNRFFLSFILILFSVLTSSLPVYGILGQQIPGIDCGMAEDTNGRDICCSLESSNIDPANKIPVNGLFSQIGNFVKGQVKSIIGQPLKELNDLRGKVAQPCIKGSPSTDTDTKKCTCIMITPAPEALKELSKFCSNLKSPNEQGECNNCVNGNNPDKLVGVWTSVGCVYTSNTKAFIENTVLSFGVGLAGLVALLCIIYSAFRLQTSQGNPESIKKAQELLTSCIMGLMLIIFSVFILRLIGVDILRIPGLGR